MSKLLNPNSVPSSFLLPQEIRESFDSAIKDMAACFSSSPTFLCHCHCCFFTTITSSSNDIISLILNDPHSPEFSSPSTPEEEVVVVMVVPLEEVVVADTVATAEEWLSLTFSLFLSRLFVPLVDILLFLNLIPHALHSDCKNISQMGREVCLIIDDMMISYFNKKWKRNKRMWNQTRGLRSYK